MKSFLFLAVRICYILSLILSCNALSITYYSCSNSNKIIYFIKALPQFNTSLQHKKATPFQHSKFLSSTPKTLQSHIKKPLVQHSSQFNTKKSSVQHKKKTDKKLRGELNWRVFGVELRGVFDWWVCWSEEWVELRGFGVELRGF